MVWSVICLISCVVVPGGVGSWARTRKPPPGRGPALTVPANIVARSRMPSSPWPSPSESADAPRPSSLTSSTIASGSHCTSTETSGSGPGVLEHVGQRLLRDPVHRQPGAGRQGARCAHAHERDPHAAGPHLLDERADVGLRRLRLELGRRAVGAAQHAEQPAHVRERGPAGLADGAERPRRGRGVGVRGVPAAVGLGDHHGQRVGDDVVHLPGDARPLGGGGDLRLLVPLDLEASRAVLQGLDPLASRPPDEPERPDGEGRRRP